MESKAERAGGINWEIETDIHTLLCIKQIANESLLGEQGGGKKGTICL